MLLKRMKSTVALSLPALLFGAALTAVGADDDNFGLLVEQQLRENSINWFGIQQPVKNSAQGPYAGLSNLNAVVLAEGLTAVSKSTAAHPQNDQIALWPDDAHPTHAIIAIEADATDPCVQVVDLGGNPSNNVKTILKGLTGSDPVRRTPWGTIMVGEEESDGGWYEILDPLSINSPIEVTDRATGATTDPSKVVKRKAVGLLAFEGIVILQDGTMYYGDENRPLGKAGGAIYKFVPDQPYLSSTPITDLANSPFVSGKIYGMRLGTLNGNTDFGQGSEIGKGAWVLVDDLPDANGNLKLRDVASLHGLTGYYRPEDMDHDPIAAAKGITRVCWANTGRMTNGGNSTVEGSANYAEILCMADEPASDPSLGSVPFVTRFFAGDTDANHFDNVAFQPRTGNLIVLEDGAVEVVKSDGSTELRGNDIWMLLPDGADRDVQSDGAIRILSLRDTDSEPTGFIFDASGENAYVHLQHRNTGLGALLKISGFKVKDE